jgi:hypothetical protein
MNGHDRFKEMLARRAELAPHDEADLRVHLHGCAECRETADAYARQTALLRSLPEAEPPPALRAGVLAAVAAAGTPAPARWSWRPAFLAAPFVAVAAAAVLALVLLNHPHNAPTAATHLTLPPATKAVPSATPTVRPTATKTHAKRQHASATPTSVATLQVTNPGSSPVGTSVAVLGPSTPVPPTANVPAATPGSPPQSGSPTSGTHHVKPTATAVRAGGPVAPRPTSGAPSVPTIAPIGPSPTLVPTAVPPAPTPVHVAPKAPTPTAVVLAPSPTPSTGIAVATNKSPTPGPGPAAPSVTEAPPTPTPTP